MSNYVLLGSARSSFGHSEKGDQSGKEVSTQGFYLPDCGYWLGFKLKNNLLGVNLGKAMLEACENNNIGYSQPYRMTAREAYCRYGSIKGIKELCTCDCSSLVNLCLLSIGVNLPNFNTASEPQVLRKSGLFDEVKVKSEKDCTTGMILVTPTKGHTLIVITALTTEKPNNSVTNVTNLKSNEEIAKEVIQGKWGNGNARKCKLEKAGYNYEEIRKLVNKMMGKK